MNINTSEPLSPIKQIHYQNSNNFIKRHALSDSFEFSKNIDQNISFKGAFFSKLFKKEEVPQPEITIAKSPYRKTIQDGLKEVFGKDISAENLDFIVTPDELKEILPTLKFENYDICNIDANTDNIYCADLNVATNFSKSRRNIFAVLDEVATLADEYNQKTGKKFLFSLTDLDSVGSVKHAIKIMGSEPEKYKNVLFIPSLKMSFTHKVPSENGKVNFINGEMIIMGINPFSPQIAKTLENTSKKRKEMILNFINDINEKYPQLACSYLDFLDSNNMGYDKDHNIPKLYDKLREYVLTKSGYGDTTDDSELEKKFAETFEKYQAKEKIDSNGNSTVESPSENSIDTIINLFKDDNSNPIMVISQPFYLSKYYKDDNPNTFNNVIAYLKTIQEKSNGKLMAFESKAPEYRLDEELYRKPTISDFPNDDLLEYTIKDTRSIRRQEQPILKKFNEFIRNNPEIELYEVGGSMFDPYKEKYSI